MTESTRAWVYGRIATQAKHTISGNTKHQPVEITVNGKLNHLSLSSLPFFRWAKVGSTTSLGSWLRPMKSPLPWAPIGAAWYPGPRILSVCDLGLCGVP